MKKLYTLLTHLFTNPFRYTDANPSMQVDILEVVALAM